jgi:hypothetical protein
MRHIRRTPEQRHCPRQLIHVSGRRTTWEADLNQTLPLASSKTSSKCVLKAYVGIVDALCLISLQTLALLRQKTSLRGPSPTTGTNYSVTSCLVRWKYS